MDLSLHRDHERRNLPILSVVHLFWHCRTCVVLVVPVECVCVSGFRRLFSEGGSKTLAF